MKKIEHVIFSETNIFKFRFIVMMFVPFIHSAHQLSIIHIISLAEMVFLSSTLCARIAKHTNEFFGLAQVTSGSQELSLSWTRIISNLPELALIVY